ncbi:DUF5685 family protein [Nocardia sp. NPDC006630]|uniref:DUF5685 family protein n=1 Tax=Nocardia sp. NPDC006630 TaxID=3157181 RepID=UPI00339EAB43
MFGLLKPCAHGAAKYGIESTGWQTQMCGLCLGLRDGHGQLARAATNTDAIVLGMLTEAQQPQPAARTTAGPCPLRGMRRASVAPADSPGVQLAATASLLLGAAKIRDHLDDGDTGRMPGRPLARVSDRWRSRARAAAAPIGLDIESLIAAIESQGRLEAAAASCPQSSTAAERRERLDSLTAPTQLCAGELFAHTAILAGRPENAEALREAGLHFGRIAHLADAIEDIEADRAAGRFNPLTATGTTVDEAHTLLRESNSLLKAALKRAALERVATVRWMLLDPLSSVIRKLGKDSGVIHTCTTHTCRTTHTAKSAAPLPYPHYSPTLSYPQDPNYPQGPAYPQSPGQPGPGYPQQPGYPQRPVDPNPGYPAPGYESPPYPNPVHPAPGYSDPAYFGGSVYPGDQEESGTPNGPGGPNGRGGPGGPWGPGGPGGPQGPGGPGSPGYQPPQPPQRNGLWLGLGVVCLQYCTCYACCAEHTSPCSGERKKSWVDRGCCDDCDPGCCDCCNCCDCDCDCCDCDCGC